MKADVTGKLWLAPLRGVTIRAFRETFAAAIREAGFAGANPVPKWGKDNIDMAIDFNPNAQSTKEATPDPQMGNPGSEIVDWKHSYFIENSLFDTNKLYEKPVEKINPNKPKEVNNE